MKDQKFYWKERLYETHLTNADLIEKVKMLVDKNKTVYCDAAEPQRIEELRRADINAKAADKDVKKGIDTIRSHAWYITKDSVNLLKEVKSYSWKEKDGKPLDEPVKMYDHLLDGGRYAVHTYLVKPKAFVFV